MQQRVRFGPFEFNSRTGELRKDGIRIKLQEKPRQVLTALLEQPGELISRKTLQERLWSSNTFVDFESGLNTAANRLRIALGDSAENPTYIETHARSGYRFISEVAAVPEIAPPQELPIQIESEPAPAPRSSGRAMALAAMVGLAGVLVIAMWFVFSRPPRRPARFTQVTFRRGPLDGARFGPDGHTILYSARWESDPWRVFLTNRASPETRTLGFEGSILSAVSSSDELSLVSWEQVYTLAGGELSRVPLNGGVPREVTGRVTFSDWSPDGHELAVIRFNGGESQLEYPIGKPLYRTTGLLSYLRISRDGSRFAFIEHPQRGDDGGDVKIFEPGVGVRTLSPAWSSAGGLAWSASGKEVWFTASRDGERKALWAVSLNGKLRQLWEGPGSLALQDISREGRVLVAEEERHQEMAGFSPGWEGDRDLSWFDWSCVEDISADGSLILFDETGEGGGSKGTVYLRDLKQGTVQRLGEGRAIALSPDGTHALILDETHRDHLEIVPVGEGQSRQLSGSGVEYQHARYFPDGRRLAILGSEKGHPIRLYIQPVEGGKPQPLTPDIYLRSPSISPDGNWIAGVNESDQLAMVPLSGGSSKVFPLHLYPVGWSKDGTEILTRDAQSISGHLSRVDVRTGQATRWKDVGPANLAGVSGIIRMFVSRDERSYAYTYYRSMAQLYVTEPWVE